MVFHIRCHHQLLHFCIYVAQTIALLYENLEYLDTLENLDALDILDFLEFLLFLLFLFEIVVIDFYCKNYYAADGCD